MKSKRDYVHTYGAAAHGFGLTPSPYLSAFRVFGCASGATGLPIIFMRFTGGGSSSATPR